MFWNMNNRYRNNFIKQNNNCNNCLACMRQNYNRQYAPMQQMSPFYQMPNNEQNFNFDNLQNGQILKMPEGIPLNNTNQNKIEPENCEELGEFIQNERNSRIFYGNLLNICQNEKHKEILSQIITQCSFTEMEFESIYKELSGNSYKVKETKIFNDINFKDGILWAVDEECKSGEKILNIFQKYSREINERLLIILMKKNIRINKLYLLYIKY